MAREISLRFGCIFLALVSLLSAFTLVVFIPLPNVPTGLKPDSLVIADVTGDGIPDIVTANAGAATASVLVGLGKGFFHPLSTLTTGQTPHFIATGDFNRDGKPDLAIANFTSNNINIFLGLGNGTFRLLQNLDATSPSAVAVADFNGDGKLDLAVTQRNSNNVAIFLGDGAGHFIPFFTIAVGGNPVSILAADFNRDGHLDLAVANSSTNDVSILFGNGNGSFQLPRNTAAGQLPAYLAVGDFNGDGILDLAVANATFSNLAVANATGLSNGTVSVLLGVGDGFFILPPRTFDVGPNPTFLVAGDFNLDGKLDVAVANTGSNTISILLGLGNGDLLPLQNFTVGNAPGWIGVADLNGDHKPDLVVANSASSSLSVLINETPLPARPTVTATVNAASMQAGTVAPGELVTIFGTNLGPVTPAGIQLAVDTVATTLSGTQVFFDNIAAPLVYASANQLTAVVPFGLAGRSTTEVMVSNDGQFSTTPALTVAPSAPALFTTDSSGSGPGAILNQDGTLNSATNPAGRGSVVALFLTGAGPTNPPSADGSVATNLLGFLANPVTVTIGGQAARVMYAGSAPGLIAGIAQVNVVVPDGVAPGAVQIVVQVGGQPSQSGVTLNIQ
jgi:uncharacterized protein (TIGR03437 family)